MSESPQPYTSKSVLRGPGWTVKDALRATDEEFWCRNPANNERHFIAGVCRPQIGDPGYHLWHELRDLIPQYFAAAEKSEDKRTNYHPMTKDVIDKAMAAIDALYGDKTVVVDGEKVPWEKSLPSRAYWILDRFCTASHGWNPILANAAARLGILEHLDILEAGDEPKTSVEAHYGPVQGDVQDDSSESGSSIKDDGPSYMGAWRSFKNDDVLEELKKGLEDQSKKVKDLDTDIGDLMGNYEIKSDDLEAVKKESKYQNQKIGDLEHSVTELTTKVDKRKDEQEERLKKHIDEQEEHLKKHIDEQEERLKKHIDEQEERQKKQLKEQEEHHKKQLEEVEKRLTTTVDEIKSLKSSVLHQSPAGVSTVTTAGGAATESVEDVFSSGTKPSTSKPRGPPSATSRGQSGSASLAPSGLFAPITVKSSSPLDGRQASLKRKASAQSSPASTPEPRRLPSVTARGQSGSASLAPSGLFAPITVKSSSPLDGRQVSLKRKASAQTSPTPTRTFTAGGRNNSKTSSNRPSPLSNIAFDKTDSRLKEHILRKRRRHKETSEEETSEEEKTKEKKTSEETPKQDGK